MKLKTIQLLQCPVPSRRFKVMGWLFMENKFTQKKQSRLDKITRRDPCLEVQ